MDYKKIDWKQLREQKKHLLEIIEYGGLIKERKDALQGILNLIDAIQDHAVDKLGFPEATIFNLENDEPKIFMSKKQFKEKCHFQHFSGGVNRRNAIYFDYKEGYGWKYKVKAHSSLINSKDLFNQFYEWIVNDELKPDYSEIRVAETDGERFKIAISG